MGSKRAKELWQSGVPLARAWLAFAPAALRSEFEQVPGHLSALAHALEPNDDRTLAERFSAVAQSNAGRLRLENAMKHEVLTDLFNGVLVATAYREAPSRSHAPVLIDPDTFGTHDPDWEVEALLAHGIRYGRVRISANSEPARASSRAKGSVDAIDRAIDQLMIEKPNFCELPRKAACQEIREFLVSNHIGGNGLSDQNLAKAIVRKCGPRRIK